MAEIIQKYTMKMNDELLVAESPEKWKDLRCMPRYNYTIVTTQSL